MQGINSISSFIILFESVFSLVSQRSSNRELIHSTLPFVCHFLHNFNKSANVLIAALKTLENLIATSSKLFIESSIGTLMTVLKVKKTIKIAMV